LERKSETEARYIFLQRIQDNPARLDFLLEFYAAWVNRMSTPEGLAELVMETSSDEVVKSAEEVMDGMMQRTKDMSEEKDEGYVSDNDSETNEMSEDKDEGYVSDVDSDEGRSA
jgi:hypothetical protein